MSKTRDDFTTAELKAIHSQLQAEPSVAGRSAIYKKAGANHQSFSHWFRAEKLPKLANVATPVKTTAKKKTLGEAFAGRAKPGPKPKGVPGRKPGRPKGSVSKTVQGTAPRSVSQAAHKSNGISLEAREILIRLMAKLLD